MSSASYMLDLPKPRPRDLFFTEQVDQKSIALLTSAILDIEKNDDYLKQLYTLHGLSYEPKPINIYIDSYGGQVYQCFGLLSIMEHCSTPITTVVTGAAMSCGFMIAIHGHNRLCYPNSTYMYHQVSSQTAGKVKDMEERIEETKRLQDKIEELTIRKTKVTTSKLAEVYASKHDWYLSPKEAMDEGIVDKIVTSNLRN